MSRLLATLSDSAMCGMMYVLQRRHRLPPGARGQMLEYLGRNEHMPRADFFAAALTLPLTPPGGAASPLLWQSPVGTRFPENDRCHALAFPCEKGWGAPTVIMLHALMSASDRGYRAWARDFNMRGWNAVFVHLPYHYSRTPRRHLNGELAITADVVRTAEGLRAGTAEVRQLMAWLRTLGCREFGLWACSYGGWIGALLAGVERDFRWITLIEPIVDLGDALWRSPVARALRRHFRDGGIEPALIERFHPLVSPAHGTPLCEGGRILFAAGEYDRIARPEDIRKLHRQWDGSTMLTEPQGHFGFRLMRAAWRWLETRGLLE